MLSHKHWEGTSMSTLTISIQHHTGDHTGASVKRQERELKEIKIGKEKVILVLFR